MKLSEKKKSELYKTVSDEIMDARIKIARLLQDYKATGEAVDKVLYQLGFDAPQKAINFFNSQTPQPRTKYKSAEEFLDSDFGIKLTEENKLIHPELLLRIMVEYAEYCMVESYKNKLQSSKMITDNTSGSVKNNPISDDSGR